ENARLFNEVQVKTAELGRSLEDLRAAKARLVQTERLASFGEITAQEIKNPINSLNNLSALSVELTDGLIDILKQATFAENVRTAVNELTSRLKANLEEGVQQGTRAGSLVKEMLRHSRESFGEC